MPKHIGIVACSAEGASLCYRSICTEGAELLGAHAHPEVSVHAHSFADYMARIYRGDWQGVADLMLASADKLAAIGAESMRADGCDAVILGCTEIPIIMDDASSPLPTLDSTRLLARAALRGAVAP